MDPINTEEPPKLKVRADPNRVMAWVDSAFKRRPIQFTLIGVLVTLLALLLGPRLWARDSILHRLKVGDRAEGNIKATRNFDYMPSDEKLEEERAAAVAKILPVFDHQTDLGSILSSRITRAFQRMSTTGKKNTPPKIEHKPKDKPKDRKPDSEESSYWQEQRKAFSETLQIEVSPKDYDVLRKAKFSAEVRGTMQVIVGSNTNHLLISHRGVLAPFKGKPILVRHLVGGRLGHTGEEKIENFNRIKDLQQVRDDIRMQASMYGGKLAPEVARVVRTLSQRLMVPNLTFNQGLTNARRETARQKIPIVPITMVKGQVIIRDGDPITKEHLNMIRAMESWETGVNVFQEIFGVGCFVLLLMIVVFRFAQKQFMRFYYRPRDLLAISVLLLALVGLTKGVISVGGGVTRGQNLPIFLYVIPLAAGAMLTRLLISAEASALFAVILSAVCGLMVDRNLGMMLFYFVTSLVGAAGVAHVQSRSTILRSGLTAGLVGGALLIGMRLFQGQIAQISSLQAFFGAVAGGVLAAFMTLALLPAMEWLFAYTTDVTLLELANLNHPLLRDLILRAPGTYHHSMIVGNLSETACDAIGANGLLARVASYYHDIGKAKNALYFAENFKPGDNPHNRLKPSMSALIIRSHVKDTIEMLRESGVPELVIDTATQHHGKTLIEFFYHKATEQKEEDEEVHQEDYRYPGPKPQTREAGVIMLADGVEAAARSLAEPTEDRLRAVVQRVINGKFTDGQLDHCDLSLRDLHLIAKSFLQVLRGIYHQRPTYPWQQESKRETSKLKTISREEDGEEKKDRKDKSEKRIKRERKDKSEKKKGEKKTAKGTEEAVKDGKGGKKPRSRPITNNEKKKLKTTSEQRTVTSNEAQNGREAKLRDTGLGESADEYNQPSSEGRGTEGLEPGSAQEAPSESSQDLKRLGLS